MTDSDVGWMVPEVRRRRMIGVHMGMLVVVDVVVAVAVVVHARRAVSGKECWHGPWADLEAEVLSVAPRVTTLLSEARSRAFEGKVESNDQLHVVIANSEKAPEERWAPVSPYYTLVAPLKELWIGSREVSAQVDSTRMNKG